MDRKGKTPLIHAVWEGKTDVVKLLLNQGANINARRCDRQTVLDIADQYGTRDMYNLLFDRGARGGRGYLDRW
jgi:ankyrin repeat protein